MPIFSYQLRDGVELQIDVDVTLNYSPPSPTIEILAILEHTEKKADQTIVRYTQEYLEAHIKKAFQSLAD